MKHLASLLVMATTCLQAQELDSSSFDFWIGEWDLKWTNPQGIEQRATNSVRYILNDAVIEENFSDSSNAFFGKSLSVYDSRQSIWRQVWTDSQGSFLSFTGTMYGDTLAFVMEPARIRGEQLVRRMIFYNISQDSFIWDWQSAPAGTRDWRLLWRIYYSRAE